MSDLTFPQPLRSPLDPKERELIHYWICWLNQNKTLLNVHAQRLRTLCGEKEARRLTKALTLRKWEPVFSRKTQSLFRYAEVLATDIKEYGEENRKQLLQLGYDEEEILILNQEVAYAQYCCISPRGIGSRIRQSRSAESRRRYRSQKSLHSGNAYRPTMQTMHSRFEGLGSETASPWFDVFFRISAGMALGSGLVWWVIHGSQLTYMFGSGLPHHSLINGLTLGALISMPINLVIFIGREWLSRIAAKHGHSLAPMPPYLGRIAFAATALITLAVKLG